VAYDLAIIICNFFVTPGLAGKTTADAVPASVKPVGEDCVSLSPALSKPTNGQGLTAAL